MSENLNKGDEYYTAWKNSKSIIIPLLQTDRLSAETFYEFADEEKRKETMHKEGHEIEYGEGYIFAPVNLNSLPPLETVIKKAENIGVDDEKLLCDLKRYYSIISNSAEETVLVYYDDNTSAGYHNITANTTDSNIVVLEIEDMDRTGYMEQKTALLIIDPTLFQAIDKARQVCEQYDFASVNMDATRNRYFIDAEPLKVKRSLNAGLTVLEIVEKFGSLEYGNKVDDEVNLSHPQLIVTKSVKIRIITQYDSVDGNAISEDVLFEDIPNPGNIETKMS